MLLGHVLQREFAWLIAHDLDVLDDTSAREFESLVVRRITGEPVAYLLGEREFYGRAFHCTPAALIPRPETELLIDAALTRITATEDARILDVGTGTGCIAITLALERPRAQVTAIDVSRDALALACENAQRLGATNIEFIQSNWFAALSDTAQFDLVVSNPPYIVPGDAHLAQGDLRYEPAIALADAIDGLESYRQLLQGARKHLRDGGWLVVEHGFDQGESVPALFRAVGFSQVDVQRDLADLPRTTTGKWQ